MNGRHSFYRRVGVNLIQQSKKHGSAKTGFLYRTHVIIKRQGLCTTFLSSRDDVEVAPIFLRKASNLFDFLCNVTLLSNERNLKLRIKKICWRQ